MTAGHAFKHDKTSDSTLAMLLFCSAAETGSDECVPGRDLEEEFPE